MDDDSLKRMLDLIIEHDKSEFKLDDTGYIYKAVYKCPLCGETFYSGVGGGREPALRDSYTYYLTSKFDSPLVDNQEVHKCKDGSIAIGEFLGFKRIKEKSEDEKCQQKIIVRNKKIK